MQPENGWKETIKYNIRIQKASFLNACLFCDRFLRSLNSIFPTNVKERRGGREGRGKEGRVGILLFSGLNCQVQFCAVTYLNIPLYMFTHEKLHSPNGTYRCSKGKYFFSLLSFDIDSKLFYSGISPLYLIWFYYPCMYLFFFSTSKHLTGV